MAVTPADVRSWMVSSTGATLPALTTEDTTTLERLLAAVWAHLDRLYSVPVPVTDDIEQAVIMQTARLWSRRSTPSGVEGFGEFGAVRVTGFDRDVEMLLSPYRQFGIA